MLDRVNDLGQHRQIQQRSVQRVKKILVASTIEDMQMERQELMIGDLRRVTRRKDTKSEAVR